MLALYDKTNPTATRMSVSTEVVCLVEVEKQGHLGIRRMRTLLTYFVPRRSPYEYRGTRTTLSNGTDWITLEFFTGAVSLEFVLVIYCNPGGSARRKNSAK
jgi:hypothetical protein